MAGTPGRSALMRLVDLAITHDRSENDHLLSAFAMLDPDDGGQPEVLAAARHAAPAAAHAAVKFALLLPPTVPAAARYLTLRVRARD